MNQDSVLPASQNQSAPRRPEAALVQLLAKSNGFLSLAVLIAAWWLVSCFLSTKVLPGPVQAVQALIEDIRDGEIFSHLGITMFRVLVSFLLTMILSIAIGCSLGLSKKLASFFNLWMVVGMTIPPLVYIVVIFLWLGLSEFSAIMAVTCTMVFIISLNIWEGVKALDKKLMEMSYIFGASKKLIFRCVIIPQLFPFIMASARFGLGLSWKMVIFVELMGRPNGVGYMINYWYSLYNMPHVLSSAILFIIVMIMIELFIGRWLEPRLFSWRPKTSH